MELSTARVDGGVSSRRSEAHHCVVQHTQSILIDCQPDLALLHGRGRDGLWKKETQKSCFTDVIVVTNITASSVGLVGFELVQPGT